jgi:hypothetical protein
MIRREEKSKSFNCSIAFIVPFLFCPGIEEKQGVIHLAISLVENNLIRFLLLFLASFFSPFSARCLSVLASSSPHPYYSFLLFLINVSFLPQLLLLNQVFACFLVLGLTISTVNIV